MGCGETRGRIPREGRACCPKTFSNLLLSLHHPALPGVGGLGSAQRVLETGSVG